MTTTASRKRFLPGVPGPEIERIHAAAPGDEMGTGKFDHPESSAALAANTFGFFLERVSDLPVVPGLEDAGWPARSLSLEANVRFPWRGGRHPWLDCLVVTGTALVGIESKRYEPFRGPNPARFSDAYWRPVWGERMTGYEGVRDALRENAHLYAHLDAAQLVKHAFALRTQVHRAGPHRGLRPVLLYLFAEPLVWPGTGRLLDAEGKVRHRREVASFARRVHGDEVRFVSCSYSRLLEAWSSAGDEDTRSHAEAVMSCFFPGQGLGR